MPAPVIPGKKWTTEPHVNEYSSLLKPGEYSALIFRLRAQWINAQSHLASATDQSINFLLSSRIVTSKAS